LQNSAQKKTKYEHNNSTKNKEMVKIADFCLFYQLIMQHELSQTKTHSHNIHVECVNVHTPIITPSTEPCHHSAAR